MSTSELRAAAERLITVHEPRLSKPHMQSEHDAAIVAMAKAWIACRDDALPIGLWSVHDGFKAMLVHHPNAATCMVRGLKTRGDVRRLCAALGVPLTDAKS